MLCTAYAAHITNRRRLDVRATSSLVGPTSTRRRSEVDLKSFRRRLDAKRTVFDLVATLTWRLSDLFSTKPILASSPVYNWPVTTSHDQLSTYFNLQRPTQQPLYHQTKLSDVVLRLWSTCYDLLATYYNLQRPPQRPLYDQTNLSWRRPLTLIDLPRPTVNLLQLPLDLLQLSFDLIQFPLDTTFFQPTNKSTMNIPINQLQL